MAQNPLDLAETLPEEFVFPDGIEGALQIFKIVRQRADGKWELVSHEGKVLGVHDTPREAYAQEAAIEHAKKRRK